MELGAVAFFLLAFVATAGSVDLPEDLVDFQDALLVAGMVRLPKICKMMTFKLVKCEHGDGSI